MKNYTKFYLYFLIIIQPFLALDLFANQNQVTLNLESHDKKIIIIEAKGRDYGSQLFAMISNTAQALVSEAIISYKVQDINLDGNDELLVQASGGGNCCPPEILLYFYDNKEGILKEFIFEEWYAWNGWDEIDIKTKNNSAILTGVDAVHRGPDLKHISSSFLFDGDIIVLNSVELKSELPSETEIRSESIYLNASSENLTMEYDMNSDGFKDKIICEFWDRWNDLTNCKVQLLNFGEILIEYGGKRLGVLKTKKNGMHMLVFDHDTIFYFNKIVNKFTALN